MSYELSIRNALPQDADTIVKFEVAMALETEGKQLDEGVLKSGILAVIESPDKGFYIIATVGNLTVGVLMITYEWSDWRNGLFWWIQSVYVEEKWRRKGVYRKMHEHVHNLAKLAETVCGIRLYVDQSNFIAKNTYHALGMMENNYDMYEINFDSNDECG